MATSLKIDDHLKSRVQRLAVHRDRSSTSIMREAIEQYVEREEARDGFHREALAAWTAYKETGLHLTGREVADWLKDWGSDAETGPPDLHD